VIEIQEDVPLIMRGWKVIETRPIGPFLAQERRPTFGKTREYEDGIVIKESMARSFGDEMYKIAKRNMPSFTSQNRDPKAKEVYRALKRDHPRWPAGKKARIAEAAANEKNMGKGDQPGGLRYRGPKDDPILDH